jgi:hypothetical protein
VGEEGYSKGVPDMKLSRPCPARTCPDDEAERNRIWQARGSSLPREVIGVAFASNFFNHHLHVTERSFVEALHLAGLRPIESGLGSSRSSP